MVRIISLIVLSVLLLCIEAQAHYRASDLSAERVTEARKLTPYLIKLSYKLADELSNNTEVKDNIDAAAAKISGFLGGIVSKINSKERAAKLFVSLKNTVGKCDFKSFEISAKNYESYLKIFYEKTETEFLRNGVKATQDYYLIDHAHKCLPQYKSRYAEMIVKVDQDDLMKIKRAFGELDAEKFGYDPSTGYNLVTMELPNFSVGHSKWRAVISIMTGIAKQIRETPQWLQVNDMKDFVAPKNMSIFSEILDEYLFKPCHRYRDQLADVLSPALFDALIISELTDDQQLANRFIHEDRDFYDALVSNRLCGALLYHKDESIKLFSQVWTQATSQSE